MSDAADSGGGPPITPPSTPLDSYSTIFDSEKVLLPEEVCERAEDKILEWLGTGVFTAFYVTPGSPPSGFPGIPSPWGMAPPVPPDLDKDEDGVNIPDDPDDEDDSIP